MKRMFKGNLRYICLFLSFKTNVRHMSCKWQFFFQIMSHINPLKTHFSHSSSIFTRQLFKKFEKFSFRRDTSFLFFFVFIDILHEFHQIMSIHERHHGSSWFRISIVYHKIYNKRFPFVQEIFIILHENPPRHYKRLKNSNFGEINSKKDMNSFHRRMTSLKRRNYRVYTSSCNHYLFFHW